MTPFVSNHLKFIATIVGSISLGILLATAQKANSEERTRFLELQFVPHLAGSSERNGEFCVVKNGEVIKFQELTEHGSLWVNSTHCVITLPDRY